jgi:hypothetical protein
VNLSHRVRPQPGTGLALVVLSRVVFWATVAAFAMAAAIAAPPKVVRFETNPIIRPEMLPGNDGANIAGPSVIRVPSWLPNPLGKYYLYFADHKGDYIRLAYADRLEGPWRIHVPGTLQLSQMVAIARETAGAAGGEVRGGHIASPDVHVDDEKREIRMYFHFQIAPATTWGHRSGVALSKDGIHFQPVNRRPIGEPYFRVFRWDGHYFAINRSAALARSTDGLDEFEVGNPGFAAAVGHKTLSGSPPAETAVGRALRGGAEDTDDGIRHTAIKIDGNVLTVFYSRAGDVPEIIMRSKVAMTGDWKTWRLSPPEKVLEPERDYEGANVPPLRPTNKDMRVLPRPMFRELRDPCIFREDGRTYLLYSVAGERGMAGAELLD